MAGLSNRQRVFCEYYVRSWNSAEAARRAGYSEKTARFIGAENLTKPNIAAEIERRLTELSMSEAEVLTRLTEHARGDIGVFFKVTDEWTEFPLPSYEVIDAKEAVDPDDKDGEKKTVYLVRHVTIDLEKLTDPAYSRLVHKFSDSARTGLSVELYDAQGALKLIGQKYGLFKDKVEVTGKDGAPIQVIEVVKDYGDESGGSDGEETDVESAPGPDESMG